MLEVRLLLDGARDALTVQRVFREPLERNGTTVLPEARVQGGVAAGAAECPFEIRRPVMVQRWDKLTYLHWAYEPAVVQSLLPPSLRVDVIDGAAWVGLIPFQMTVSLPGVPAVPWVSRFLETNVRTYVHDREGRSGIWFFSLDAARLGAVVVARATYRLPYFWSRMRMIHHGNVIVCACSRRWPDGGLTSSISVEIGAQYLDHELTAFDHWLTARWILFGRAGDRHRFARATHPPWPLHRARALHVDDGLVQAAGLPRPAGDAIAHHSPGVPVRIGLPERDATPS